MRWIALFALVPIVLGAIPKCEKTVITQQRTLEAQGVKVNLTISECADADKKQHGALSDAEVHAVSSAEKRTNELDTSIDFAKRQTKNTCKLPASQCTCGIDCTDFQCSGARSNISSLDCTPIIYVLDNIGFTIDGTFVIEPGQRASVTYNNCTASVFNNEAIAQEYCYDSFTLAINEFNFICGLAIFNSFLTWEEGRCSGGTVNGVPRFFVEVNNTAFIQH